MTTLKALTPEDNIRFYNVRVKPHFFCNKIIAPNAPSAVEQAINGLEDKDEVRKNIVEVRCEDIYTASIDLSCDERDNAPDDLETENGLFDITIRGTDPKRVNELKLALMHLIGFPGGDEDDDRLFGSTKPLERALEGVMVDGY